MSFVLKYIIRMKAFLPCLFDTFLTGLARPLLRTTREMKLIFFCVEHLTGCSLDYPTSSARVSEVIFFIKQLIFYSFESPRLIISDSGLSNTAGSFQKLLSENDINWKTELAYPPKSDD